MTPAPRPTRPAGAVFSTLAIATAMGLSPAAALAYVGPGAGLTAIGTMIALLAALVLAVVGFVWYPIKRMVRSRRSQTAPPQADIAKEHG